MKKKHVAFRWRVGLSKAKSQCFVWYLVNDTSLQLPFGSNHKHSVRDGGGTAHRY